MLPGLLLPLFRMTETSVVHNCVVAFADNRSAKAKKNWDATVLIDLL